MKRIRFLFVCTALAALVMAIAVPVGTAAADTALVTGVKAAYLCDVDQSVEMYADNADSRFPIASMVKIMTALLTVEALDNAELSLTETVCVSPTAMGMGGSQMFLNAGDNYPVGDLLKGVIVVSANDACVALAERLAGSEQAFVAAMNQRAEQLGMTNTHFANCTGLPHPEGYSCARDVAAMLCALVGHDVYHTYSGVWLEDYTHPDGRITTFTNTNKLIRFYQGCDGGKTGFTQEAGFCLAATAVRRGMRVVSVVIGSPDSRTRFANSSTLLNYAFANYKFEALAAVDSPLCQVDVLGGKSRLVDATVSQDLGMVCRVGQTPTATVDVQCQPVKAPVAAGDKVGEAHLVVDGVVRGSVPLVAAASVDKATYGDAIQDFLGHYHL